jgi:hypothetical protein
MFQKARPLLNGFFSYLLEIECRISKTAKIQVSVKLTKTGSINETCLNMFEIG